MNGRLLRLIAMAGAVIGTGATLAGLAPEQSFDGAYKGSLDCEQMSTGIGILRTPLAMIVRNGRIVALVPIFDIDSRRDPSAMAGGTVDADGALHLAYTVFTS